MVYVFFGVISGIVGIVISFVIVFVCFYFGVDLFKNLWVIAIPVIFAVLLNFILLEIYFRRKKK